MSKLEDRLYSILKHRAKYKIPIIDQLGYLPLNHVDEELLYQLIIKCTKKSTIVATNLISNECPKYFTMINLIDNNRYTTTSFDNIVYNNRTIIKIKRSYKKEDILK